MGSRIRRPEDCQYFSIKNFDSYQHYKQRNPPWVKLYYSILDDEAFISLPVDARCHYFSLLLVASKKNNRILNDKDYLKKVLRLDSAPDITPLFHSGFLLASCYQQASNKLDNCKQSAMSETETDNSETETDNSDSKNVDASKMLASETIVKNGKGELSRRKKLELFEITDSLKQWALDNDMPNPLDYIGEFKDYWRGLDEKKMKTDWEATMRNKLRYVKNNPNAFPKERIRQGLEVELYDED